MLKVSKMYAGCYRISGHYRDYPIYIERSCVDPKTWRCEDRLFGSLSNAKAFMFEELSNREETNA
jgi:hypothetical protein